MLPPGTRLRLVARTASPTPATGNYLVYASPVVPNGSYVLKVRVTGLKDLYSSGTKCTIDRVLIQ